VYLHLHHAFFFFLFNAKNKAIWFAKAFLELSLRVPQKKKEDVCEKGK